MGENREKKERIRITLTLATLVGIVTILGILLPMVTGYGAMGNQVQDNTETIKNMELRVIELEKLGSRTEVVLTLIQEDLSEIKVDIKDVRKVVNSNSIEYANGNR